MKGSKEMKQKKRKTKVGGQESRGVRKQRGGFDKLGFTKTKLEQAMRFYMFWASHLAL